MGKGGGGVSDLGEHNFAATNRGDCGGFARVGITGRWIEGGEVLGQGLGDGGAAPFALGEGLGAGENLEEGGWGKKAQEDAAATADG